MKLDKKFCHYKRAQRVLSSLGIAGEKLIGKKESKFIAVTVYYSPDWKDTAFETTFKCLHYFNMLFLLFSVANIKRNIKETSLNIHLNSLDFRQISDIWVFY